jgi:hypothetical protein
MILWGPLASLVWIALYGVSCGLAYLNLRYVAHRGGFWQIVCAAAFLLLGASCGFIGYSIRHMFLVAPFIGYALAGVIGAASIPVVKRKYREWWVKQEQSTPIIVGERYATEKVKLMHYKLTITADEARVGITKKLTRKGKKLEVSVPPGVTAGTVVRLSNALQLTDDRPGDILIEIEIRNG